MLDGPVIKFFVDILHLDKILQRNKHRIVFVNLVKWQLILIFEEAFSGKRCGRDLNHRRFNVRD